MLGKTPLDFNETSWEQFLLLRTYCIKMLPEKYNQAGKRVKARLQQSKGDYSITSKNSSQATIFLKESPIPGLREACNTLLLSIVDWVSVLELCLENINIRYLDVNYLSNDTPSRNNEDFYQTSWRLLSQLKTASKCIREYKSRVLNDKIGQRFETTDYQKLAAAVEQVGRLTRPFLITSLRGFSHMVDTQKAGYKAFEPTHDDLIWFHANFEVVAELARHAAKVAVLAADENMRRHGTHLQLRHGNRTLLWQLCKVKAIQAMEKAGAVSAMLPVRPAARTLVKLEKALNNTGSFTHKSALNDLLSASNVNQSSTGKMLTQCLRKASHQDLEEKAVKELRFIWRDDREYSSSGFAGFSCSLRGKQLIAKRLPERPSTQELGAKAVNAQHFYFLLPQVVDLSGKAAKPTSQQQAFMTMLSAFTDELLDQMRCFSVKSEVKAVTSPKGGRAEPDKKVAALLDIQVLIEALAVNETNGKQCADPTASEFWPVSTRLAAIQSLSQAEGEKKMSSFASREPGSAAAKIKKPSTFLQRKVVTASGHVNRDWFSKMTFETVQAEKKQTKSNQLSQVVNAFHSAYAKVLDLAVLVPFKEDTELKAHIQQFTKKVAKLTEKHEKVVDALRVYQAQLDRDFTMYPSSIFSKTPAILTALYKLCTEARNLGNELTAMIQKMHQGEKQLSERAVLWCATLNNCLLYLEEQALSVNAVLNMKAIKLGHKKIQMFRPGYEVLRLLMGVEAQLEKVKGQLKFALPQSCLSAMLKIVDEGEKELKGLEDSFSNAQRRAAVYQVLKMIKRKCTGQMSKQPAGVFLTDLLAFMKKQVTAKPVGTSYDVVESEGASEEKEKTYTLRTKKATTTSSSVALTFSVPTTNTPIKITEHVPVHKAFVCLLLEIEQEVNDLVARIGSAQVRQEKYRLNPALRTLKAAAVRLPPSHVNQILGALSAAITGILQQRKAEQKQKTQHTQFALSVSVEEEGAAQSQTAVAVLSPTSASSSQPGASAPPLATQFAAAISASWSSSIVHSAGSTMTTSSTSSSSAPSEGTGEQQEQAPKRKYGS